MTTSLRVLIVTDSFPPNCGGSGWSTWELVRGLIARGHHVSVVHAVAGRYSGIVERSYESVRVTSVHVNAPPVPFVRNVVKNEWFWRTLRRYLADTRLRREPVDLIHAQHVMTTVPSIEAGEALQLPVVATIRDYWPVCYWSDLIYDPGQPRLCPRCTATMMTRCVRPRAGAATPAAWPFIPYMRMNLARKRRTLARASAIVAVSSAIARDLVERAPEIPRSIVRTVPNPVDMTALDAVYERSDRPMPERYVLYAGKLATNKGVQYLLPALDRADVHLPLVVVGDGPERLAFEAEARQRGRDVRVLGWQDRTQVWTWMRHAELLAFPSYGPESLSRVLLESAALGTPIAAMNTGGTADIIRDRETGLLSADASTFARDLRELAGDDGLRRKLGAAARIDVHTRFAATAVVARIEDVYRQAIDTRRG